MNHSRTVLYNGATPAQTVYATGQTYGDRSLRLTGLALTEYQPGATVAKATLTLKSTFQSAKKSVGAQVINRDIKISAELDAANRIVNCIALAKMSDGIWQRVPSNLNNIFYQGATAPGWVGIGTATPQSALHISQGDFLLGNHNGFGGGHPPDGLGPKLLISNWYDHNTDQIYLQRNDYAFDWSELRIVIGDNFGTPTLTGDRFVVGATEVGLTVVHPALSVIPWDAATPGRVGVGKDSPQYPLDVVGDINSSTALRINGNSVCTAAGCAAVSDARLKTHLRPLGKVMEKIRHLKGFRFEWLDQAQYGSQTEIGFIAQQVERVFPELVRTDPGTGIKSVIYDHIVVPLLAAVQELSSENEAQKQQLRDLNGKLEHYQDRLEALEKRLEELTPHPN